MQTREYLGYQVGQPTSWARSTEPAKFAQSTSATTVDCLGCSRLISGRVSAHFLFICDFFSCSVCLFQQLSVWLIVSTCLWSYDNHQWLSCLIVAYLPNSIVFDSWTRRLDVSFLHTLLEAKRSLEFFLYRCVWLDFARAFELDDLFTSPLIVAALFQSYEKSN